MAGTLNKLAVLFISSSIFVLSGCTVRTVHDHHHHGYGPPPHAPAHGYRAKYHEHDLVYDSRLGVYVVVDLPDVFYHDGYFYRYRDDDWYYSRDLDRDWKQSGKKNLPPGLAKNHTGKGRGRR